MSKKLENKTSHPSTSSVVASPAKMSAQRAKELASVVHAAACGLNSYALLKNSVHNGSLSKTSQAEQRGGSMLYPESWKSKDMQRFRSLCRRWIAELHKDEKECFLWPTPRCAAGMVNKLRNMEGKNPRGRLEDVVALIEGPGGYLNPPWVGWLQGFPIGHTELKP
jgi:hypothetical protein